MPAPTTPTANDTDTSWMETLPPEDDQSTRELIENYGKNLVRAVLDGLDSGEWKTPAPTGVSTDV